MRSLRDQQDKFIDRVYRHQGILYRICSVYTQDTEDWNDLWQEILMQLWKSYPSFGAQSSFSTWMYRVALNTALMHRRQRARRPVTTSAEEHQFPVTENPRPHADEDVQLLYRCIQELPRVDRAIILLKLELKSYQEISEITGFSVKNVSVRIVRIKEKLRQLLIAKGYKEA